MWHIIDRIGDQAWRTRIGARIEALTDEVFQVLRWVLMVAFARYLALRHPGWPLDALYWALAVLLFGYLAARLLLRPELAIFQRRDSRWRRLAQSAANLLLCVGLFTALLWGVEAVTGAVVADRMTTGR